MPIRLHQTVTAERARDGGREIELRIRVDGRDGEIPSTLLLPTAGHPVAAALLVHGFSSTKEAMVRTIGDALLARGIASLAVDLPLHGARSDGEFLRTPRDPLTLLRELRHAVTEGVAATGYLGAHQAIDRARLATVGFSLGSWVALRVAASQRGVRAVVVAGGGDLPDGPVSALVRPFVDPIAAVRAIAGTPLLMVHGRDDRTIPAAQAQRLFDAASEPRTLTWFAGGHWLPPAAIETAADWLHERLRA